MMDTEAGMAEVLGKCSRAGAGRLILGNVELPWQRR